MRLAVLTPSRGRPQQALRLAESLSLCEGDTDILFGLDYDDITLSAYMQLLPALQSPHIFTVVGEREALGPKTNTLWAEVHDLYTHFASFGDDHLPRTQGWDLALMTAAMPTGISYGDDTAMGRDLTTAPVITADIPEALGWVCLPGLRHYCVDNVWKDLGSGAGCLTYCPEVVVEHLHHTTGKSYHDSTYAEAGGFHEGHPDYHAYLRWRQYDMENDVATVSKLCAT
jgi:hypothetical protein